MMVPSCEHMDDREAGRCDRHLACPSSRTAHAFARHARTQPPPHSTRSHPGWALSVSQLCRYIGEKSRGKADWQAGGRKAGSPPSCEEKRRQRSVSGDGPARIGNVCSNRQLYTVPSMASPLPGSKGSVGKESDPWDATQKLHMHQGRTTISRHCICSETVR
ncbi:hypothetical protein BD310DRAFT_931594 [Dichomitus squalens]|uniref:Uncharacterized protein n=1 Tax=Dichomitus squalens TaxID=114155 RepID=A0A4Q9PQ74_9APHY|nr:hypothetical protein BD310DRAFT_931594 [Dichomitus squalens]